MNSIIKAYREHERVITLAFFFFFWFGILSITGTLTSGYHFMDDHEILEFKQEFRGTSITNEVQKFVNNLVNPGFRFRPFYLLHRRAAIAVFGTHLFAWSIYNGLLAVFTSLLLFLFMRRIGFSQLESILFSLLTLLGEQAAIWWQLGPTETQGIFLLAASLLCLAQSVYTEKRKKSMEVLFVFFAILASWTKESFVLIIPALAFWKILLVYEQGNSNHNSKTVWQAIKENILSLIVLLSVCLWEMIHILNAVTLTKIRYGGNTGFNFLESMASAWHNLVYLGGWMLPVLLVIIGAFIYQHPKIEDDRKDSIEDQKKKKNKLYTILPVIFLAGMITGPQILLYMKSGITERYQLPAMIGITFLIMVMLRYIREHSRREKIQIMSKMEWVIIILLVLVFLNQLRITRYTAIGFARAGQYTTEWFQSILQNTSSGDVILVITEPIACMEASYSLQIYMNMEMNRQNILFSTVHLDTINKKNDPFWGRLNNTFFERFKTFSLAKIEDRRLIGAILVFPGLEKKFLKFFSSQFKPEQFRRYTNPGGFVSYYKTGAF